MRRSPEKRLPPGFARWNMEATELIHEIRSTARCLADPMALEGCPLFPSGSLWALFEALTRSRGVPAIVDVARSLRVSKQAAHRIVRSAARAGYIELVSNPGDRRILQVRLTGAGRAMLADARARETRWAIVVLNGYSLRELRQVSVLLRVLRHRVLWLEREHDRDLLDLDLDDPRNRDLGDLME